jgi:hypothetical protein
VEDVPGGITFFILRNTLFLPTDRTSAVTDLPCVFFGSDLDTALPELKTSAACLPGYCSVIS